MKNWAFGAELQRNSGIRLGNLSNTWDSIILWSCQSLQVWDNRYNLYVQCPGVRALDRKLKRIWYIEVWLAKSVAGCIRPVTLEKQAMTASSFPGLRSIWVFIKSTPKNINGTWRCQEVTEKNLHSLCFSGSYLYKRSSYPWTDLRMPLDNGCWWIFSCQPLYGTMFLAL